MSRGPSLDCTPMNPGMHASPLIGVFDSGCGGLSILRSLRRDLPTVPLRYLADNLHLPYGDKPTSWLEARAQRLTQFLLDDGATLILIACNTATTHTIAALRARWPKVPFVGVEPGIKPAVSGSRSKRIAVLATSATLASARVDELIRQHAGDATILRHPCPGLADAIDLGDDAAIDARLDDVCGALRESAVDTVVLGCTHYPLIADRVAERLGPEVALIDTADAVSRRVVDLLGGASRVSAAPAATHLLATGDPAVLQRAARRWIDPEMEAQACDP
jgi:glutamate racemase